MSRLLRKIERKAKKVHLLPLVTFAAAAGAAVYAFRRFACGESSDEKIDEMSEQSFPASDAPAW